MKKPNSFECVYAKLNQKMKSMPSIRMLTKIIAVALAICICIGLLNAIQIIRHNNLGFCLAPLCFEFFFTLFKPAIDTIKTSLETASYIAAAASLYLASKMYIEEQHRHALTIHKDNIKQFSEHINSLVQATPLLAGSVINESHLYSLLFPSSKTGNTEVSQKYSKSIERVSSQIKKSESLFGTRNTTPENHMEAMRDLFFELGININLKNFSDFLVAEGKALEFLDSITKKWTDNNLKLSELPRNYR